MIKRTATAKATRFPEELLAASLYERVAYFRAYTARHPHLDEAVTALMDALDEPAGTNLVIVYGPPGAGKTTLLEVVMRMVIEEARAAMGDDPGWVPIVGFPAVAPCSRSTTRSSPTSASRARRCAWPRARSRPGFRPRWRRAPPCSWAGRGRCASVTRGRS